MQLLRKYMKSMTIWKSFQKSSIWVVVQNCNLKTLKELLTLTKSINLRSASYGVFYLNSWKINLYLITISKQIDLNRSAWRQFVDDKSIFYFLLNFSCFFLVRYILHILLKTKLESQNPFDLKITHLRKGTSLLKSGLNEWVIIVAIVRVSLSAK